MTEVNILRIGLSLPCPVPVVPGTPDTMRAGEPIDLAERTERCGVDAWFFVGAMPVCDVHLRDFCKVGEIDFDGVVAESGGLNDTERKPWVERHRYPQDEIQDPGEVARRRTAPSQYESGEG